MVNIGNTVTIFPHAENLLSWDWETLVYDSTRKFL